MYLNRLVKFQEFNTPLSIVFAASVAPDFKKALLLRKVKSLLDKLHPEKEENSFREYFQCSVTSFRPL